MDKLTAKKKSKIKKELKLYNVVYYFDGQGECKIKAKSKKEAEEKWRSGEFEEKDYEEWGDDYICDRVDLIN